METQQSSSKKTKLKLEVLLAGIPLKEGIKQKNLKLGMKAKQQSTQ